MTLAIKEITHDLSASAAGRTDIKINSAKSREMNIAFFSNNCQGLQKPIEVFLKGIHRIITQDIGEDADGKNILAYDSFKHGLFLIKALIKGCDILAETSQCCSLTPPTPSAHPQRSAKEKMAATCTKRGCFSCSVDILNREEIKSRWVKSDDFLRDVLEVGLKAPGNLVEKVNSLESLFDEILEYYCKDVIHKEDRTVFLDLLTVVENLVKEKNAQKNSAVPAPAAAALVPTSIPAAVPAPAAALEPAPPESIFAKICTATSECLRSRCSFFGLFRS